MEFYESVCRNHLLDEEHKTVIEHIKRPVAGMLWFEDYGLSERRKRREEIWHVFTGGTKL